MGHAENQTSYRRLAMRVRRETGGRSAEPAKCWAPRTVFDISAKAHHRNRNGDTRAMWGASAVTSGRSDRRKLPGRPGVPRTKLDKGAKPCRLCGHPETRTRRFGQARRDTDQKRDRRSRTESGFSGLTPATLQRNRCGALVSSSAAATRSSAARDPARVALWKVRRRSSGPVSMLQSSPTRPTSRRSFHSGSHRE